MEKQPEREISIMCDVRGKKDKRITAKGIVDTGNTLKSTMAISKEFHEKLGVGFKSLKRKKIGTASKGASMFSLGISNTIKVRFPGLGKTYDFQPRVIASLHSDINVGGLFLKKVGAKLNFSMQSTLLSIDGESTELIQTIGMKGRKKATEEREARKRENKPQKRMREKSSGGHHVLTAVQDTKCMKDSLTFVPTPHHKGMIRVYPMDEGQMCQPVGALYQNFSAIAMLNLGENKVSIKKGDPIAHYAYVRRHPASREERVDEVSMETDIDPGSPEEEEKIQELWTQLKLEENQLLSDRPDVREKVRQVLRKHWKVFSTESRLIGETDLLEFEVELEPGAKPHRGKVRPLNPTMKQSLKDQLDLWMREGVAEECVSPWASPMVPVGKPNGGTRWCVDYRKLNSSTVADSYPLPNISENIDRLAGGKVFSTLDASQAYHTIPVSEGSKKALAFITPFGLYTFARMPFGARNAGATYSRFVQMCLDKLRSPFTLSYLDDIIMFTTTLEEHVEELDRVLAMHSQAGIKLVPGKTFLFREEVDYLGFRVGKDGVKMKEDYVEKILNWPSPKSTKEVRSMLGFCGYYRSFIRGYARLTNEMNTMRSAKKFEWTPTMEKKFRRLKEKFKAMPIRSFPRFDIPDKFQISSDWSCDNVSAVLSQVQDGQERLIAVFGRKTTSGERNYPPWKGELSAMVYGIRKAEHILRYRPFIANTDASALTHLTRLKSLTGILARWLQELQTYNFEVKHKRGIDNGNADGVSRASHLPEEEPEDWDAGMITEVQEEIDRNLDREMIIEAQRDDEDLIQVRRWLTDGKPSHEEMKDFGEDLKAYAQQEIKEEPDGMLVRYVTSNKSPGFKYNAILVPEKFRDAVFFWSHQHPSAGHFSADPTAMRARMKWYYPGMVSDMKRKIKMCTACLAKARVKGKDCAYRPRKSGFPGERLNIDLVGPLPKSVNGNLYILTIEDSFSRFCQAIPIRTKDSKHVADALIDRHVCTFGCPLEILSDQGGEFVNHTWKALCKRLEIKKKETPPYNPNANPVERFHRTLNAILRTFMDRDDPSWERYLPMATLAYNSKCHSATGQTPFLVWMGREARLPIDIIVPTPHQRYETVEEHVQDVLRRFHLMFSKIKEKNEAIYRRNAKLYSGKIHDYKMGDRVFYYTGRRVKGKPTKLTFGWLGPYKLVRKISDVIWVLEPVLTEGDEVSVHVTRIRPYYGPRETGRAVFPGVTDIEDLGDELAEELTNPVAWVPPMDEFHTNIPIRWGQPEAMIRDLPKKKQTKDAEQQSDPVTGGAGQRTTGTRRKTRPAVPQPRGKRERDMDSSATDEAISNKQRDRQVEISDRKRKPESDLEQPNDKRFLQRNDKRGPESDPDKQPATSFKKRVMDLLRPNESSMDSATTDTSEEEEEMGCTREREESTDMKIRIKEKVTIPPGGVMNMKLKTDREVPKDCWMLVMSRPNLARKKILVDSIAVRDAGDLTAVVRNEGIREVRLEKGQRVAQSVLVPICDPSTFDRVAEPD